MLIIAQRLRQKVTIYSLWINCYFLGVLVTGHARLSFDIGSVDQHVYPLKAAACLEARSPPWWFALFGLGRGIAAMNLENLGMRGANNVY